MRHIGKIVSDKVVSDARSENVSVTVLNSQIKSGVRALYSYVPVCQGLKVSAVETQSGMCYRTRKDFITPHRVDVI